MPLPKQRACVCEVLSQARCVDGANTLLHYMLPGHAALLVLQKLVELNAPMMCDVYASASEPRFCGVIRPQRMFFHNNVTGPRAPSLLTQQEDSSRPVGRACAAVRGTCRECASDAPQTLFFKPFYFQQVARRQAFPPHGETAACPTNGRCLRWTARFRPRSWRDVTSSTRPSSSPSTTRRPALLRRPTRAASALPRCRSFLFSAITARGSRALSTTSSDGASKRLGSPPPMTGTRSI